MTRAQTQPWQVNVVCHAQQYGLSVLRLSRSTRSFRRQLPLDRREDSLDPRALAVVSAREAPTHLCPSALYLPVSLPALDRDDAVGADDFSNVLGVALAVELCVDDNQPNEHCLMGTDQRAQCCAVVKQSSAGYLRQHVAAQDINAGNILRALSVQRVRGQLQPYDHTSGNRCDWNAWDVNRG